MELKDYKVIISPEVLTIPEFSTIFTRDKSKDKSVAFKELSYIYYMTDPNSPYADYPEVNKINDINNDIMQDSKWKPDIDIKAGIQKYKELTSTPVSRLLNAVYNKIDQITGYLNDTNLDADTLDSILMVIKNVSPLAATVGKLKGEAEKESTAVKTKVRGQQEVGDYERA